MAEEKSPRLFVYNSTNAADDVVLLLLLLEGGVTEEADNAKALPRPSRAPKFEGAACKIVLKTSMACCNLFVFTYM